MKPLSRAAGARSLAAACTVIALAACSSAHPEGIGDTTIVVGDAGFEPIACQTGTTRACGIMLGQHNGVLSCYEGTQACINGVWGACGDGQVQTLSGLDTASAPGDTSAMGAPGNVPMALGASSQCANNPCDPTCVNWQEQPDAAVVANPQDGGSYNWQGGTLADLPAGLVNGKAIIEPCEWGADCQFDHYCDNVRTDTACAHSKCATGVAMPAGCMAADPCVNAICELDGSCCAVSCTHDPCVTGAKLAGACDSCVASICAAKPACCTTAWTQDCVDAVATSCGGRSCQCPSGADTWGGHCYKYYGGGSASSWNSARDTCRAIGTGWDLVTVDSAAENNLVYWYPPWDASMWIGLSKSGNSYVWSDGEAAPFRNWWTGSPQESGNCVELWGDDGTWTMESCNSSLRFMCEGGGSVLSGSSGAKTWGQSCVDKVASVCGAQCGSGNPPASNGTCVPWMPGQTDPSCAGYDLSVAVPCDNVVPICNRGNTTVPAGIPIIHYPGNSPQYGVCNPVAESQQATCWTAEAIPPGQCISVTTCNLNGNRQLYVNPPQLAGHVQECSCLNNWAESHANTSCGPPECSGTTTQATIKPVNMYFMVDKSGSMGSCTNNSNSKWDAARKALRAFFSSPDSANYNVALEFFRLEQNEAKNGDDGCGPSCTSSRCANPIAPLGTLTAASRPTDTVEKDLVYWLENICPGGMTPTFAALDGALSWGINHQPANPNELNVVVLVTDGEPTECNTNNNQISDLAQNAFNSYGIRTYPIGMPGASYTALDQIAQKGGTGSAIRIDPNSATPMETQLLTALRAIAGEAMSCELDLPQSGMFNPNDAQVIYKPGAGNTVTMLQASSQAQCDATHLWYYDNNASPTKIFLCSSICTTVKADTSGRIEVHLGCPSLFEPTEYSQVYVASCPPGTHPQWGYFAYETTTPSDSSVVFAARTAEAAAGLTGAFTTIATASAATSNQVCSMSSGSAGCPVDLYDTLGAPTVFGTVLELKATLNPTSDKTAAPKLTDWALTYSCPPIE